MKQIIKERLTDRSDWGSFKFSLACSECGAEWQSTPVAFSKAGIMPMTESKNIIFQALYDREKAQALSKAVCEAMNHFNLCPICGELVCNDCFLICDDLDMCRSCAGRLQEAGEQVSFVGWMVG